MSSQILIGTRKSPLAQWQAQYIRKLLSNMGYETKIVLIESSGDKDLLTPLYEIGIQGIFTKSLDNALINNQVDIAVHSLKDVPTRLAKGLILAAIPKRANALDLLVLKNDYDLKQDYTIATSSLRRKAQWLHKYPNHSVVNIRGNVNLRLEKLENNQNWDAAIFAQIGLERLKINPPKIEQLNWMLPAPAQGALGVFCRSDDKEMEVICEQLNDPNSNLEVSIERTILRACLGGCTLPLGAFAKIENNLLSIVTNITSVDGKQTSKIEECLVIDHPEKIGIKIAKKLLENGGQEILDTINNAKND
tara:strand:- start:3910 stop:4827 length:918 start_codon:yes stop_codon:yes gene_type:complete